MECINVSILARETKKMKLWRTRIVAKMQINAIFRANNLGSIADFFFPPLSISIFLILKKNENNLILKK